MTEKLNIIEPHDIDKELYSKLYVLFRQHYEKLFEKSKEKNLEFENLNDWLADQFEYNVGTHWIISDKEFLTFSETNDCLVVHHLCANSDITKILLLKRLTKVNKKKRFVAAVRKADEETLNSLTEIGCKQIQNPLSEFSNSHYTGIEITSTCAAKLSLLPNDLLIAMFK